MSTLNSFQKELFSFLEKRAVDQFGEVPPILQSALLSKNPLRLDEIVSETHRITTEQSLFLERRWLSAFSEKEFAELGMSAYFPRVYRGLPRLYARDNPTKSRIKQEFQNLPLLKQIAVEKALFSLYRTVEMKRELKVVLFVWVIPDGLGDWIAAAKIGELLQQKFEVEIVAVSEKKLPSLSIPSVIVERGDLLTDAHVRVLREADVVIQTPTFFPETAQLIERMEKMRSFKPMPKIEHLGEYGYLESSWFHPKSGRRSMGLHVLEKGVLTRAPSTSSFAHVKNIQLLLWLFGKELPEPGDIDAYLQKTRFHLAYLSSAMGGAIYLNALLKMWEQDDRAIDVCTPDPSWFIRWTQEQTERGAPSLLANMGLQQIELHTQEKKYIHRLEAKGKVLRILSPGPLSNGDMEQLMALSGPWVAVRGDQSFSEAISSAHPFFYDGREHARYFLKDLAAIAENRIRSHVAALQIIRCGIQAFLWNLPEEQGEWVDETYFQSEEKPSWDILSQEIGIALQNPDAQTGFQKLCSVIVEEHSANDFLIDWVKRLLSHRAHPELYNREHELLTLYGKGELSFSSLVKNCAAAIDRI